jgi:hypothetical protein
MSQRESARAPIRHIADIREWLHQVILSHCVAAKLIRSKARFPEIRSFTYCRHLQWRPCKLKWADRSLLRFTWWQW